MTVILFCPQFCQLREDMFKSNMLCCFFIWLFVVACQLIILPKYESVRFVLSQHQLFFFYSTIVPTCTHISRHLCIQGLCRWMSDFGCLEGTVILAALQFTHTLHLCILADSQSKQWLFPWNGFEYLVFVIEMVWVLCKFSTMEMIFEFQIVYINQNQVIGRRWFWVFSFLRKTKINTVFFNILFTIWEGTLFGIRGSYTLEITDVVTFFRTECECYW